jgi:hypothetical protein
MTAATLRQALAYARRGWPVFPCLPGEKIPATRHGYRDATTDQRQITAWFSRGRSWNLAIATGTPGPDVLDVDQHGPAGNGFAALARLHDAGLLTEASAWVRTPSAGLHAYFAGSAQRNGHLPGCYLDFRSAGGYVLAPPSQIAGHPYQLLREPAAMAAWTGTRSPSSSNPSHSTSRAPARRRPPVITSATWPAGSPPSPKATATPACSGPPTAPWTPTPPPT